MYLGDTYAERLIQCDYIGYEESAILKNYLHENQTSRLYWWGGNKDVTREGLLRPLLAQTVVGLEHVTLSECDEWDVQDTQHLAPDNILFTLADGRRWELLDAQESDMRMLLFKEIESNAELVTSGDLEREPEVRPFAIPLEGRHVPLPWIVTGITEVWTVHDDHPYLAAAVLWGEPRPPTDPWHSSQLALTPLLAVYVSGDEFWITRIENVFAALESALFVTRNMVHHFYGS